MDQQQGNIDNIVVDGPNDPQRQISKQDTSTLDTRNTSTTSYINDKDEETKEASLDAGDQVNYQTMNWFHLGLLMLAETVSLGILSLPWAIAQLGFREGIALTLLAGLIATYTGYIYGQFKLAYPHVTDVAGAGEILGRCLPWAGAPAFMREFVGIAAMLVLVFIQAAHVISFALMMHALAPNDQTCAIVWYFTGALVQFVFTIPRTMRMTSYISFLSSLSVVTAVVMVVIDVGIKYKHAPQGYTTESPNLPFNERMLAILNIVVSYAGHVAYLAMASELKRPEDFNKALYFQLSSATTLYTIVGGVIYYYVGPTVTTPALGAASPTIKKAAWGVASLTIVAAGVVNAHVSSKYVYVKFFRNTMHKRSWLSYSVWIGIVALNWIISWLLAEIVPSFAHMLGLVCALFSAWFSFGFSSFLWFNMYWTDVRANPTIRKIFMAFVNLLLIAFGAWISFAGIYAIISDMGKGMAGMIFRCNWPS